MISNHGQYIAVRNKGITCKFEAKRFHNFDAYVVYPSDTLMNLMRPEDQLKKKIRESINLALKNNITYEDVQKILHECCGKLMAIQDEEKGMIMNPFLLLYFVQCNFYN